ncbi:hypothetical protein GCM10022221_24170 [Actinocorallia aurea]
MGGDMIGRRLRKAAGAGALLALAVAGAVGCAAEEPTAPEPVGPPAGVTFEAGGPEAMRSSAAQAITKIREKDAAGLAALDLDAFSGEHGGAQSEAGARWLVDSFAEPLSGDVSVAFEEQSTAGDSAWFACLSYGSPKRELALGFVAYNVKDKPAESEVTYYFPASTYPTEGEPSYEAAGPESFCRSGWLRTG